MRTALAALAVAVATLALPALASAYPIVISELQVRGSGGTGDEFVELLNVTDEPVTLTSDWHLTDGSCSHAIKTFAGEVVPARGHLVITGAAYDGAVASDGSYVGFLNDQNSGNPGGGVGLFRAGERIDVIGYMLGLSGGPDAGCWEGDLKFAGSPAAGDVSFARKGADQGQDTADNSADFDYGAASGPQGSGSARAPDVAAKNYALPSVSGDPREGQTLSAAPGTWFGGAPYSYGYMWLRCDGGGGSCAAIPGATSSTYTLEPGDVGHTLRVSVGASNGAGGSSADSPASAVIAAAEVPQGDVTTPPGSGTTTTTTTTTTTRATPVRCVVPKLKGRTLRQARRALKSAHCTLGKVKRRPARKQLRGRVTSQSKKAGKRLAKGARVDVVVGRRP